MMVCYESIEAGLIFQEVISEADECLMRAQCSAYAAQMKHSLLMDLNITQRVKPALSCSLTNILYIGAIVRG